MWDPVGVDEVLARFPLEPCNGPRCQRPTAPGGAAVTDRPVRCACGHFHLTTRGPCTGWTTCGCNGHRVDVDDPLSVARRRRQLLEAVDSCPHTARSIRAQYARERTG